MSSAGDEAADLAASAGLYLDEWQRFALDVALGERADGTWSAFEVGLIAPRQNGKGSILEARELAGLFLFDERLLLHSAHEFKTAWEAFLRVKTLIENTPDLSRKVSSIRQSHADVCIELHSGARLRFVARSRGSGRGFSGDCVILDEAYNLDSAAMAALLPTLSARPNPQIWYASSAGMVSSTQLHAVRNRVSSGEGVSRLAWLEWSAPEDVDPLDREAWAMANPALGIRISEEFIESEFAAMSGAVAEFKRERLGVWDSLEAHDAGPVNLGSWQDLADAGSQIVGTPVLALDVNPEHRFAAIGAAGRRADGLFHVETTCRKPGTAWVLDEVQAQCVAQGVPVRVAPSSPAGAFIGQLRERGVEVVEVSEREHLQACGALLEAVVNAQVRHLGQVSLESSVRVARQRPSGDAWLWSRVRSSEDISALVAVTLALGGVPASAEDVFTGGLLDLDDY